VLAGGYVDHIENAVDIEEDAAAAGEGFRFSAASAVREGSDRLSGWQTEQTLGAGALNCHREALAIGRHDQTKPLIWAR